MMGFDELIEQLLYDVALAGSAGIGAGELERAVRAFYDRQNQGKEPKPDEGDVLLFSEEPPHASVTVDTKLVNTVWTWLASRPDIHVRTTGVNKDRNESPENGQSPTSSGISAAQSGHRLVASVEKAWLAITGHGVDYRRVPAMEFDLLSIIAARGPEGILQPELTRISQQDKRSVPNRTDQLAKKGYVTKDRVIAVRAQTAHIKLWKFGNPQDSHQQLVHAYGKSNQTTADTIVYLDRWFNETIRLLKENNDLIALEDLRLSLDVTKTILARRAFGKSIKRLVEVGLLRKLRAQSSTAPSHYIRCVQLLREPTDEDMVAFRTKDLKAPTLRKSIGDSTFKSLSQDPDEDTSDEEDRRADEEVAGAEIVIPTRWPPQWNPDLQLTNFVYNVVHEAGQDGISSMDLNARTMGMFWRKALDELMLKLTDIWQTSQPTHLRHLAIVRDTGVHGRTAHYKYYSLPNFQKAVDAGKADWKTVIVNRKASGKKSTTNRSEHENLDQWGFPRPDPRLFARKNGQASLLECQSAARHEMAPVARAYHSTSRRTGNRAFADTANLPSKSVVKRGVKRKPASTVGGPAKSRRVQRTPIADTVVDDSSTISADLEVQLDRSAPQASQALNSGPLASPAMPATTSARPADHSLLSPRMSTESSQTSRTRARSSIHSTRLSDRGAINDDDEATANSSIGPSTSTRQSVPANGVVRLSKDKSYRISKPGISAREALISELLPRKAGRPSKADIEARAALAKQLEEDGRGSLVVRLSVPKSALAKYANAVVNAESSVDDNLAPTEMPSASVGHDRLATPIVPSEPPERPTTVSQPAHETQNQSALQGLHSKAFTLQHPEITWRHRGCGRYSAEHGPERGSFQLEAPAVAGHLALKEESSPVAQDCSNYPGLHTKAFTLQHPEVKWTHRGGGRYAAENHPVLSKVTSDAEHERSSNGERPLTNGDVRNAGAADPDASSMAVQAAGQAFETYVTPEHQRLDDSRNEHQAALGRREFVNAGPVGLSEAAQSSRSSRSPTLNAPNADPRLSLVVESQDDGNAPDEHEMATDTDTDTGDNGDLQELPRLVPVNMKAHPKPVNPGSRRVGIDRRGGSVRVDRVQIVMDAVKNAGGVFPSAKRLWQPFQTAWERKYDQTPDQKTVNRLVDEMLSEGLLNKFEFTFKEKAGKTLLRDIVTLPEIGPTSRRAKKVQKAIIDCHPHRYVPKHLEEGPAGANLKDASLGFTNHADRFRSPDETRDSPYEPPLSPNGRQQFIDDETLIVQRTHPIAPKIVSPSKNLPKNKAGRPKKLDQPIINPPGHRPQDVSGKINTAVMQAYLTASSQIFYEHAGYIGTVGTIGNLSRSYTIVQDLWKQSEGAPDGIHDILTRMRHARNEYHHLSASPLAAFNRELDQVQKWEDSMTRVTPIAALKTDPVFINHTLNQPHVVDPTTANRVDLNFNPETPSIPNRSSPINARAPPKIAVPTPAMPTQTLSGLFNSMQNQFPTSLSQYESPSGYRSASVPTQHSQGNEIDFSSQDGSRRQNLTQPRVSTDFGPAVATSYVSASSASLINKHSAPVPADRTAGQFSRPLGLSNAIPKQQSGGIISGLPRFDESRCETCIRDDRPCFPVLHMERCAHCIASNNLCTLVGGEKEPLSREDEHEGPPAPVDVSPHAEHNLRRNPKRESVTKAPLNLNHDQSEPVTAVSTPIASRPKAPRKLPEKDVARLNIAVALIDLLCNSARPGAEPKWSIVAHALAFEYDTRSLKETWNEQKTTNAVEHLRLRKALRDPFLAAYESGELPTLDFDHLEGTDWPALVRWVQTEVLPLPDAAEVPTLPSSRARLEDVYRVQIEDDDHSEDEQVRQCGIIQTPRFEITKSWARAVALTKESEFNMREVTDKLASVKDILDEVLEHLEEKHTLVRRKSGRRLPGRNFLLAKGALARFQRWPGRAGDYRFLRDVANGRGKWLEHLQTHNEVSIDQVTSDKDILLFTEMLNQGHLELRSVISEAALRQVVDTGKLNENQSVLTTVYEKTATFTAKHGLKSGVLIPNEALGTLRGAIPMWVDIRGNLIDEVWDMVLRSILHILVFKPGSTVKAIEEAHGGHLWKWEIELVLSWMQDVGLAVPRGNEGRDGEKRKMGWRASEWWYCAFVPDIATWQAPSGVMELVDDE